MTEVELKFHDLTKPLWTQDRSTDGQDSQFYVSFAVADQPALFYISSLSNIYEINSDIVITLSVPICKITSRYFKQLLDF